MPADTTSSATDAPKDASGATSDAERRSGLRTIRKVTPYLWPKERPDAKVRVVLALLMLLAAKLVTVGSPMLYKGAVDALAEDGVPMLALGAVAAIARCDLRQGRAARAADAGA